jgi:hypothetical protein
LGCTAVVVDTISEPARNFYHRYGFMDIPDDKDRLYMTMLAIRASLRL